MGTNPGNDVNDPGDDRALRLPDLQLLSLQVRSNLKPLIGHNAEVFSDIVNILSLRTTTSVVEQDGASFGQPDARLSPMTVRFGFRYRY